jgi:hypothetical protein
MRTSAERRKHLLGTLVETAAMGSNVTFWHLMLLWGVALLDSMATFTSFV